MTFHGYKIEPYVIHEDGYETFCFTFLSVFLALTVHKTYLFFEKITNQIFPLNYAQLICEPVQSENKRFCAVTVNSPSIATTLFSPLKVLRFHKLYPVNLELSF